MCLLGNILPLFILATFSPLLRYHDPSTVYDGLYFKLRTHTCVPPYGGSIIIFAPRVYDMSKRFSVFIRSPVSRGGSVTFYTLKTFYPVAKLYNCQSL